MQAGATGKDPADASPAPPPSTELWARMLRGLGPKGRQEFTGKESAERTKLCAGEDNCPRGPTCTLGHFGGGEGALHVARTHRPPSLPSSAPALRRARGSALLASAALGLPARPASSPLPPRPSVPQRRCGLAIRQLPQTLLRALPLLSPTQPPPAPALGLQVNETLVFLSHLFCFPAKF